MVPRLSQRVGLLRRHPASAKSHVSVADASAEISGFSTGDQLPGLANPEMVPCCSVGNTLTPYIRMSLGIRPIQIPIVDFYRGYP